MRHLMLPCCDPCYGRPYPRCFDDADFSGQRGRMPHLILFLLCLLLWPKPADAVEDLVFVPSKLTPEVAVLDSRSDTVVRRLRTGSAPLHATVSAELGLLLVTTSWRGDLVNLIDVDGILATGQVALDPRPDGIALDPAGRVLAVSSLESDRIALVDLATRRQTASVASLATPHHLAFSGDGRRLYVANLGANRVTEIDVAAGAIARQFEPAPADADLGGVGNLAILPDGRRALAAFGGGSELALIDLNQGTALRRVPVGELPWHAFATMDGSRILVPYRGEDTIAVLDGATLREIARVPAGTDIVDVSFGWFESVAFVLSRGDRKATAIDVETGRTLGEIALPGVPEAGVATRDGQRLYVALGDTGGVAVLDMRARRLAKVIGGVARRPWGVQMAGAFNYCR
jgi:DNA-binding beta-propeller fold protein YncE